ncbi:histidine phosphatase family protein [Ningiella sp. W23]|uniref:histidine phosphatase family protein n=1 Tax=Ningiella sp. W23 TaxID=3023715 RepID=UPI003756C91D
MTIIICYGLDYIANKIKVNVIMQRNLSTLILLLTVLTSASGYAASAASFDIYLIRHFEKAANTNDPDVPLSQKGASNAQLFSQLMSEHPLSAIYSTDYVRTRTSVSALAKIKSLDISLYDPRALSDFAMELLAKQDNAVIAGHSNTTGVLYAALGCEEVVLGANDYGDIFVVHVDGETIECSTESLVSWSANTSSIKADEGADD